jgi:hypothetical protein
MWDEVSKALGPTLAAVGATALGSGALVSAAYALFKIFAEKWLTSRFDANLAAYKHAQQKELEHLRSRINALLDRATKLHEKEFEVLPAIWEKLRNSYDAAKPAVLGIRYAQPDLDAMSDVELEEFLNAADLSDRNRRLLKTEPHKLKRYERIIDIAEYDAASAAYNDFYRTFEKGSIFVEPTLRLEIRSYGQAIKEALIERNMSLSNPEYRSVFEKGAALADNGEGRLDVLREKVASRLWLSHELEASNAT